MSTDLITQMLAERATSVGHRGPDLDALHARIDGTRRRRQGLAAVTASSALVAALAVGAQLLGGSESPPPIPSPTVPTDPDGTRLPVRPEQVEFLVPDSAREDASRMRVVERHENEPGSPLLEVDVTVDEDRASDTYFCEGGEPGLWLVVRTSGNGGTAMPCGQPDDRSWDQTMAFNRYFSHNTSNLTPRVPRHIRIFVTTADGERAGPRRLAEGMPATTDARFGMTIRGQTSPTVGTLLGYEVSVLGEGAGRDWWFTRGVEAATGAESLSIELPASGVDRFVQVVSRFETGGPIPQVQLRVDGEPIQWPPTRTPYLAFLDNPCTVIPAGGSHTAEVRVVSGSPRRIDLALAVFEAGD